MKTDKNHRVLLKYPVFFFNIRLAGQYETNSDDEKGNFAGNRPEKDFRSAGIQFLTGKQCIPIFPQFQTQNATYQRGRADERCDNLEWRQEMEKFGTQDGQQDCTGWDGEIDCKESAVKLVKSFRC